MQNDEYKYHNLAKFLPNNKNVCITIFYSHFNYLYVFYYYYYNFISPTHIQ